MFQKLNVTKVVLSLALMFINSTAYAAGNISNDSFSKAKKMLEREVYQDHRVTIYCGANFDAKKTY